MKTAIQTPIAARSLVSESQYMVVRATSSAASAIARLIQAIASAVYSSAAFAASAAAYPFQRIHSAASPAPQPKPLSNWKWFKQEALFAFNKGKTLANGSLEKVKAHPGKVAIAVGATAGIVLATIYLRHFTSSFFAPIRGNVEIFPNLSFRESLSLPYEDPALYKHPVCFMHEAPNGFLDQAADRFDDFTRSAAKVGSSLTSGLSSLTSTATSAWESLRSWGEQAGENEALVRAYEVKAASQAVNSAIDWMGNQIAGAHTTTVSGLNEFLSLSGNKTASLWDATQTNWNWALELAGNTTASLQNTTIAKWNEFLPTFGNKTESLWNATQTNWNWALELAGNTTASLQNTTIAKWNEFLPTFRNKTESLWNATQTNWNWALELAGNKTAPVWQDLQPARAAIQAFVLKGAKGATNPLKPILMPPVGAMNEPALPFISGFTPINMNATNLPCFQA